MNGATPIETVVNIIVNGNVSDVVINKGVTAKIHFTGDLIDKAARPGEQERRRVRSYHRRRDGESAAR